MSKELYSRTLESELIRLKELYAVVVVTGPRQSGKTTLCKKVFPDYHYVNLERINEREQIAIAPEAYLKQYSKGIIIDEVQQFPELFSYIQVVSDENPESHFILTGSSNFSLMEKVTQSLAGRAATLTLLPFSLRELDKKDSDKNTDTLLFNGGYPVVWAKKIPAQDVSKNYYNTYIERDVRQLLNIKDLSKFQVFMKLCAARIGTEFNASALSNEIGVAVSTIGEWVSVLEASYVLFKLPPFYKNIGKRLVKSSKIYFYDTGLACFLMGIENEKQLTTHPLRGMIFENYIVLEFLKNRFNRGKLSNLFFYRDKSQREIDIVQELANGYAAFEIKSAKVFHKEFLNNLNYLKKLLNDSLVHTQVIFDGNMDIRTSENGIMNFRNVDYTEF